MEKFQCGIFHIDEGALSPPPVQELWTFQFGHLNLGSYCSLSLWASAGVPTQLLIHIPDHRKLCLVSQFGFVFRE